MRQVRLRWVEDMSSGEEQEQHVARCQACGHQPSVKVFREHRLRDLLPEQDEWPDESGVRWSENLPDTPEGADGAVLLVLGPREWDSLGSRVSLQFQHQGVAVEVVKGRGPGVGFAHDDGTISGVTVHLPGEAVGELHQSGRWGASVGGTIQPVHVRVVVRADA